MPTESAQDAHLPAPSTQPITARLAGAGAMRREIEAVLTAVADGANADEYQAAIMEQNAARKSSQNARMWAWKRLKLRYALDSPDTSEFDAFRRAMRDHNPAGRGLVCALMLARTDRLFRDVTLEVLAPRLPVPASLIEPESVSSYVEAQMLGAGLSWSEESRKSVSSHFLSSWRDLGLIEGVKARRTKPIRMTHAALRFAIELGRATGLTDRRAMSSVWFQLLGLDYSDVESSLYEAARAGALDYRAQADVVEINLPEEA